MQSNYSSAICPSLMLMAVSILTPTLDAGTVTLVGPLPQPNPQSYWGLLAGWPMSGLQITALQEVTLESFIIWNGGYSAAIELLGTNGDVLESVVSTASTPSSWPEAPSLVTVGWQLHAGTTYDLVSVSGAGVWTGLDPGYFPISDTQIRVNGTWLGPSNSLNTDHWFVFTDLTTSSETPEPSTGLPCFTGVALMLIGGAIWKRLGTAS
jgi:hypothetical protein